MTFLVAKKNKARRETGRPGPIRISGMSLSSRLEKGACGARSAACLVQTGFLEEPMT